MKKYILLLVLSILSMFSSLAFAEIKNLLTGKELLEYCQVATDISDRTFGKPQTEPEYMLGTKTGVCIGYLTSANERRLLSDSNKKQISNRSNNYAFCLPPNYNFLLGAAAIVKYLKLHPEEQSLPASLAATKALNTYFPCIRA